jgi:phosphatidylserine/phosphatidylglycerophosphate/cardiolipin synthase-like enzyme/membrane protein DedA with SNARE-associated domain
MGSVFYLNSKPRNSQPPAVASKAADGQAAGRSLLRPGYNCFAVARAGRVAMIIDAEHYFRAFYEAALKATRTITILAWDFNSQTRLHFDPVDPGGPPPLLGDFLNWLAHRRKRLHIRVLNWDYPMVFGADRELPPLYGFGWTPHRRVELRYDDTHPVAGCQHQKIVLIDDKIAFTGGIDLTVRRWDSSEHAPEDPRRVAYGKPYPPFHDLMVAVDGDAARALSAIARERWVNATGHTLKPVAAEGDPWPERLEPQLRGVDVGIARTAPARGEIPAVKEIERLYIDMIRAARETIYIENQYFTSPRIAAALAERLAEPQGPEIVLVLRRLSHGWLEEATMHVLRTRLLAQLKSADRHGRFRVMTPHIPGLADGCCLDVHSKLMIVDDRLLRIGSANLCNRSMSIDTECDVLVESLGDPVVAAEILAFRDRLLAEHLDVPNEALQRKLREHGSVLGAIDALRGEGRSLHDLEPLPAYPDALVDMVSVADPDEPISLDFIKLERTMAVRPPERPAWGRLAAIAIVVIALAALWRFTPLAAVVTPENAIAWAKEFGSRPWAPFVVMAAYTPACFVMFPRPLITLAAVIAFGPYLGFLYAMLGIVFSAIVTYFVGMRMRRDTVRRLAGPRLDQMVEVLRRYGLLAMTLLRLVPLAPFFVEGLIAGAVRLRLRDLTIGTAIGLLPGTLATTIFGDQLESAFSGGEFNWWVVGGAVALLVGGSIAVKRWFSRMAGRLAAGGEFDKQPR